MRVVLSSVFCLEYTSHTHNKSNAKTFCGFFFFLWGEIRSKKKNKKGEGRDLCSNYFWVSFFLLIKSKSVLKLSFFFKTTEKLFIVTKKNNSFPSRPLYFLRREYWEAGQGWECPATLLDSIENDFIFTNDAHIKSVR